MIASVTYFICSVFIGLIYCQDKTSSAKLRYYYHSIHHFTELPLDEAEKIFFLPWYNSSRNTVIFSHGFTGHPQGPAVISFINCYLEQGESNVVLLNWEDMAAAVQASLASSYLNWAAPNARKLGVLFADTLISLSEAGLDLNKTHLVGHSLGAQLFGIAGNNIAEKGIHLPWITGLDPAGVGFENKPLNSKLHSGSANFVAVIHSDPSKYGYKKSTGTVDFWPNYKNVGPVKQPGCDAGPQIMFSRKDLCNHNRSWQLLVDALKYPGTIIASYAKNYRTWKSYSEEERSAIVLDIAKYETNAVPGNYYFVTNSISPFGLGRDGL